MGKMQKHIVDGKQVFVGLEDSRRSWSLCVRSGGEVVQEPSLPADYGNLQRYLQQNYSGCAVPDLRRCGSVYCWS